MKSFHIFHLFVHSGRAGLVTPFIYYHFLALRYSSRRNPYSRNMFHELRLATDSFANNPKMPPFVKKLIVNGIKTVERLAPAIAPAQH